MVLCQHMCDIYRIVQTTLDCITMLWYNLFTSTGIRHVPSVSSLFLLHLLSILLRAVSTGGCARVGGHLILPLLLLEFESSWQSFVWRRLTVSLKLSLASLSTSFKSNYHFSKKLTADSLNLKVLLKVCFCYISLINCLPRYFRPWRSYWSSLQSPRWVYLQCPGGIIWK